jgi:hypothetical protein
MFGKSLKKFSKEKSLESFLVYHSYPCCIENVLSQKDKPKRPHFKIARAQ